jgi:hypothetical protein
MKASLIEAVAVFASMVDRSILVLAAYEVGDDIPGGDSLSLFQ